MRSTGHIGNYGFRKGRNTKSGALWRNPRNTTKLGGLAKTPMAMSGSTRAVPKYHAYALAKKDWEKRKGEGRKEEFDDLCEDWRDVTRVEDVHRGSESERSKQRKGIFNDRLQKS